MVLDSAVFTRLKTTFGYESFRPLQEDIIASVLAGQDTLVLMPTGGGKSLCYQLPSLIFEGITLVISPLIALMKDQVDTLRANGVPAAFLNSTLSAAEINLVQAQAQRGELKILYLAPERLALPAFRRFLQNLKVSLIAIDEAHCISEWGHEFRPDYRNLNLLRQQFPETPVIALTATATERVRGDILAQLGMTRGAVFQSSFNRANLTYLVQPKRDTLDSLLSLLSQHPGESTIIYCLARRQVEALADYLRRQGVQALAYHAGLDNQVRQQTQERFLRDRVPVIVATIAFGMGIDKPDIRLVVHYDLPKSIEGYYQETGRAGRDGLPSQCVLFYSFGDKARQEYFLHQMENPTERENARQKLSQMVEFCETSQCRRQFLLEYFGEEWHETNCHACDACLVPREEFDATEIAQKVLSAVVRTGERFGQSHIINVLRGSRTRRMLELKHDQLTVHGIAREYTEDALKDIIGQMTRLGLLEKIGDEYPTLRVTNAGRDLLRQRAPLTLVRPIAERQVQAVGSRPADEYDQDLFQQLRALRRQLADERNVPPFVIFSDVTLRMMATNFPQSRSALSAISGVGKMKLEQFGDQFIEVIRRYAGEHELPERTVTTPKRDRDRPRERKTLTLEQTRDLYSKGLSIRQVAQQRNLAESTILKHLERLIAAGEPVDLERLLPTAQRRHQIVAAFQDLGTEFLTPVKEQLGPDYTYEELHLVRMHLLQLERGRGPATS